MKLAAEIFAKIAGQEEEVKTGDIDIVELDSNSLLILAPLLLEIEEFLSHLDL